MIKPNKTYILRESSKQSAKDRMRLHELSHILERNSQPMFFTQKKRKKQSIIREKKCHEHCTIHSQTYIQTPNKHTL